jgi:Tol biopolymer transport system component
LDSEGGGVRRLSEQAVSLYGADAYYVRASVGPRWSPDGKVIGYLASSEGAVSLWVVTPDGRNPRPVLHGVEGFDWYLDSRRVIYTRTDWDQDTVQMRAANLETGREVTLLEEPHTELIVRPDGGAVAYCRAESHYNLNLYLLQLTPPDATDGLPRRSGEPEQLTNGFAEGSRWHVHNGGWSPDGKDIVYTQDTDKGDIYIIETYQEQ